MLGMDRISSLSQYPGFGWISNFVAGRIFGNLPDIGPYIRYPNFRISGGRISDRFDIRYLYTVVGFSKLNSTKIEAGYPVYS